MDPAKHKEITAKILQNLGDQAIVSGCLAELVDDYTIVSGDIVQKQQALSELQKKAESLQKTNMDLFLRIPVPKGESAANKTNPDPEQEAPSIESLFDPKTGKLKE